MVVELLCTTSVIPVPSARPSSGARRTSAIHRRNTGLTASGAMAPDMTLRCCRTAARSRTTASPSCRVGSRRASDQTSTPTNRC